MSDLTNALMYPKCLTECQHDFDSVSTIIFNISKVKGRGATTNKTKQNKAKRSTKNPKFQ